MAVACEEVRRCWRPHQMEGMIAMAGSRRDAVTAPRSDGRLPRKGVIRRTAGLLVFLGMILPIGVHPAQAAEPRFVSILFGRNQWVQAENCVRMANTVDLGVA